jgi:hypothetical protein
MIEIKLTCATADEARALLAALAAPDARAATVDAASDLIGALVTAPAEPPAEPAAPAAEPPATPAPVPTLDEAVAALRALGREQGAAALRAVLDQLGVKRATEIAPERAAEVIALVANGGAA